MGTLARHTLRVLLTLVAAVVALVAVRASAQAPGAIDAFPGIECAFEATAGGEICAVELAPGMRVEAPRAAWLTHPDSGGFDVNHGDTHLSVRYCPGSVAAGRFCLDTLRGTQRSELPRIPFLSAFVSARAAAHHARPRPRREPTGRHPRSFERSRGDAESESQVSDLSHTQLGGLGAGPRARLPQALDRRRADDVRGGRRAPLLLLRGQVRVSVQRQAEAGEFRIAERFERRRRLAGPGRGRERRRRRHRERRLAEPAERRGAGEEVGAGR